MPSDDDNHPPSAQLPQLPDLDAALAGGSPARPGDDHGVRPISISPDTTGEGDSAAVRIAGPAEADPHLGKTFGGYVLETKIGQGGMGTVYRGRQVSLDRVVAVKILNKALSDNTEFIKRFEREAKSIARVSHANIVAVYDFGKYEGLWFMVNEFIEGSSLAKLISERMVVPLPEFLPLVVQCLSGLALVGRLDIVHRDIKPDNILITKDTIPKIADFGLAKSTSERQDTTDLTAIGLAMGTPAYMSPEQCMGHRIDHRSDQYAMGVTAYLALTGSKPFTGASSFEIMTRQRELTPPPPHQLNPSLPSECSAIVMRMLAKDPADRFPDAEACRLAWLGLAQQLDPSAVLRSGEHTIPNLSSKSSRYKTPVDNLPVIQPAVVSPAPEPRHNTPPPAPPAPPPVPVTAPTRTSGEFRVPAGAPAATSTSNSTRRPATDHAEAEGRPPSERHPRHAPTEAITCPRCGHLNRAAASSCQRCSSPLRQIDAAATRTDQEVEAQRLLDGGRHREAAVIFSRLADNEQDRRLKSVLRAKEREARRVDQDRQLGDLQTRARTLVERGDIPSAIEMLEQARGLFDVTSSTASVDQAINGQINQLRSRLRTRRRLWTLLAVVLALALAAGGVAWVMSQRAPAAPTGEQP
jgi:serine/threonine protein kinase